MILIRIILSPLLFAYAAILLGTVTVIPILPFLVFAAIANIIATVLTPLFRFAGVNVEVPDSVFDIIEIKPKPIPDILGVTIYFWFPFYVMYLFLKSGKVFQV